MNHTHLVAEEIETQADQAIYPRPHFAVGTPAHTSPCHTGSYSIYTIFVFFEIVPYPVVQAGLELTV